MDCEIKYKECKISGSHSSVGEDPGILGSDALSLVK
jgi:hypothetical protein